MTWTIKPAQFASLCPETAVRVRKSSVGSIGLPLATERTLLSSPQDTGGLRGRPELAIRGRIHPFVLVE